MPIRLLFLLIFLPSTFLSSLNVSHVDALSLYEPQPLGWNNRFFQGSQEHTTFVRMLYNLKPSDLPSSKVKLSYEEITALLLRRSPTLETEEKTRNFSQQNPSHDAHPQSSKIELALLPLQRRAIGSNKYTEETSDDPIQKRPVRARKEKTETAGSFIQETDPNSENPRSSSDEERTPTPTTKNGTATSATTTKTSSQASLVGPRKVESELADPGVRGAIIIGASSMLIGILLLLRKNLIKKSDAESGGNSGAPNDVNNYNGGFDISGPLGAGATATQNWNNGLGLDPGSGTLRKPERLTGSTSQVRRPSARSQRTTVNTVSLPSQVKVTRDRTKLPASRQGTPGLVKNSSTLSSARSNKSATRSPNPYDEGPPVLTINL